jgi:membrane peptidoglycan carboxypeptidase
MPIVVVVFGALSVVVLVVLLAAVWGLIWFGQFAGALPSVDELTGRTVFQTMPVFTADGTTKLYEITDPNGGRRTVVPLSEVPRPLIEATIATEDAGFFSNPGFELRSILRAGIDDLTHQQIVSGASTITQQVVRNVLLSPADRTDLTARRKIKEIVVAYQVTQTYSKDDILEIYLNEIYYGNHNYGIEAAAQGYFGESAGNLSLAQAAMLAGIPQAPGFYDPYNRFSDVKARQEYVLGRMVEQGYITGDEASDADAEDVHLVDGVRSAVAPHFIALVTDEVESKVGSDQLYRAGDQVVTTLDASLQNVFDQDIQQNLDALHQANGTNVAAVALDPSTGAILAMVGSASYDDPGIAGEVNMALAPRPSGGILTPATFSLALYHGLTLVSPIEDPTAPVPSTTSGSDPSAEPVRPPASTVRDALGRGLEGPAAAVVRLVGNQGLIDLADATGLDGFAQRVEYGPNHQIAGARVSPLEVAQVYGMFANAGIAHRPYAVQRILDRDNNVLNESASPDRAAVDPGIAYLISSVLVDNPLKTVDGNSVLDPALRVATHSGISEDGRDGWVAGYVPNLVVVMWVGAGGVRPLANLDPALRAWGDIMRDALKLRPPAPIGMPPDVIPISLCKNAGCSSRQVEYVIKGTEGLAETANAAAVARPTQSIGNSRTPLVGRDQSSAQPTSPVVTGSTARSASNGAPIAVPDVSGATLDQGRERLLGAGLRVAADPRYVSGSTLPGGGKGVAVGQIASTTPPAGAQVPPGTEITLVVRRN